MNGRGFVRLVPAALIVALAGAACSAGAGAPSASVGSSLAASPDAGDGGAGRTLTLGYIGWDESVAIANLSKILLEEQLGYEEVELKLGDVGVLFEGVGSGDLAAFQDVWMPNHTDFFDKIKDDAKLLEPWFKGTTQFSLAAPSYMNIDSIDQIAQTEATQIFGIEPGAVIMEKTQENVIPEYGLDVELVGSSTPAMLAEVERRYTKQDPFIFIAWSPHWMNAKYDFRYLADPKKSLGNLTDPSELTTVVNNELETADPVAYAFLDALELTDDQVNEMEAEITSAGDPVAGVRAWLEANGDVVQPWIDAANAAG